MEKKNYLKPDFALNNIKTTSFIAASVEVGEGGTSCQDPISDTILEDLFWVNTNYHKNDDGPFDLTYFKEYLQIHGSVTIHAGLDYTDKVTIVQEGRTTYAKINGLSFEKNANYTVTLVGDCLHFEKCTGSGWWGCSYIVNVNK